MGQLHHEPVSPEQSQSTGSLAQSVMLRLPTRLCSWLPEPASPEVGSHKTRYAGCPPTAASRAQGREKGVSEASHGGSSQGCISAGQHISRVMY